MTSMQMPLIQEKGKFEISSGNLYIDPVGDPGGIDESAITLQWRKGNNDIIEVPVTYSGEASFDNHVIYRIFIPLESFNILAKSLLTNYDPNNERQVLQLKQELSHSISADVHEKLGSLGVVFLG